MQGGLEPMALLRSMAACSVLSPGAVVPSHQGGWTGVCMVTGRDPNRWTVQGASLLHGKFQDLHMKSLGHRVNLGFRV